MRLFGFNISRTKAVVGPVTTPSGWLNGGSSWYPIIREPFTGAWQRNMEVRTESVLTYSAVYACISLIASDVAKIRLRLVEQDDDGIWSEVSVSAFSPVLRKPNRYQNRIKFIEQWIVSRLVHGNAYILKERDARNVVVSLYVLDPCRVKPLVAPDGSVYYELRRDNLSGVEDETIVLPANEIIHDTMVSLYHPLCGVTPITACGLAAMQGISIQKNSNRFFENGSKPSGVFTAPGEISQPTADRVKAYFEENFRGENVGRIAVLGDGLKYEQLTINAVDSQLIEQLKWSAETVCSVFHVPPYMIGIGTMPTYNNIEALNQQYYAQCLQSIIESIELCLDEGLGLTEMNGKTYGTEFDLDDLLRMDTATQVKTMGEAVKGILSADEARKKLGFPRTAGGSAVLSQQQNFSLEALAKRDAKDDPFASAKPPTAAAADAEAGLPPPDAASPEDIAAQAQLAAWELKRHLDLLAA